MLAPIYHFFALSLGGHMVISHNRKVNPYLEKALYILFFYSSFITPHFWSAIHIQHHKHFDTEKDPQSPKHLGLKVLFPIWNIQLIDKRTYLKHKKSELSNFFDKYYAVLCLLPGIFLFLFPLQTLLIWMVPASLALSQATFSAYYSHRNGEPVSNWSLLYTILFLGETGNHKMHHDNSATNSKLSGLFYD